MKSQFRLFMVVGALMSVLILFSVGAVTSGDPFTRRKSRDQRRRVFAHEELQLEESIPLIEIRGYHGMNDVLASCPDHGSDESREFDASKNDNGCLVKPSAPTDHLEYDHVPSTNQREHENCVLMNNSEAAHTCPSAPAKNFAENHDLDDASASCPDHESDESREFNISKNDSKRLTKPCAPANDLGYNHVPSTTQGEHENGVPINNSDAVHTCPSALAKNISENKIDDHSEIVDGTDHTANIMDPKSSDEYVGVGKEGERDDERLPNYEAPVFDVPPPPYSDEMEFGDTDAPRNGLRENGHNANSKVELNSIYVASESSPTPILSLGSAPTDGLVDAISALVRTVCMIFVEL